MKVFTPYVHTVDAELNTNQENSDLCSKTFSQIFKNLAVAEIPVKLCFGEAALPKSFAWTKEEKIE